MSNIKVQMKRSVKAQVPNFGHLNFGICLTFACLREAPPAEASCGGQALRRRQGF
jgi:hypothetical protein